jgi:hypothetical protein
VLIYVAGPYTAPTEEGQLANTETAMRAGYEILRRGHWPVIPHLNHFFDVWVDRDYGEKLPPQTYYDWDKELLDRCDALLFLASSFGADRELERAISLGIHIYESLNQIPEEE